MTRCSCGNLIVLPLDLVEDGGRHADPTALQGDLCDACIETDLASAGISAELNEMDKLERKLRERP